MARVMQTNEDKRRFHGIGTFSRHSIASNESNSIEEIFGIGYQELAWANFIQFFIFHYKKVNKFFADFR